MLTHALLRRFHNGYRSRICDSGLLWLDMEEAGIVGSIQLNQLTSSSELVNIVSCK